ncbi:UDP-2,3-diacylglucosamine diphosphatase [Porphyromonadaceae bacterium]
MTQQPKYRTIVLSDVHLGTKWSKADEATRFIEENSCETLILCGDIIDGWSLNRNGAKWKKRHTRFIKALLDLQHRTEIFYVRGNHDDFLDKILPFTFQHIHFVQDMIYRSGDKRFLVLHGDLFDSITSRFSWLAKIGDWGYTLLLYLNKLYNQRRVKKGLPYFSLSKEIKKKVKASVSYISDFENHLVKLASKRRCDGVICGHIHTPEIRMFGNVAYLNAGDWVESLSALVEQHDSTWHIHYSQTEEAEWNWDKETEAKKAKSEQPELVPA